MRFLKSAISMVLVISMLLSLSIMAFADDNEATQPAEVHAEAPAPQPEKTAEPTPEPPAPAPQPEKKTDEQVPVISEEPTKNDTEFQRTPAAPTQKPKEESSEIPEVTAADEETVTTYTWTHPVTKKLYTNLTYEEYVELLRLWKLELEELLAEGIVIPGVTDMLLQGAGNAAKEPEETVTPETTEAETEPAVIETEPADATEPVTEAAVEESKGFALLDAEYHVEYTIGNQKISVSGKDGISAKDLLAGLGVEIPEGAKITIDPDSIDTKNLTVTEVDGVLMITSNGAFLKADRDLVILVDGVPTTIHVTDPTDAGAFVTATQNKTTTVTADTKITNGSGSVKYSSGTTVIDLNGKTIIGDDDADYVFEIEPSEAESDKPVSVTFLNGTIVAAKNAIKAAGNAVVNFFNVTIKAAAEALGIQTSDSGDGSEAKVIVNIDSKSKLYTTDSKSEAATIMLKGNEGLLNMNGTVINEGKGFAIANDGKNTIVLGETAQVAALNKQQDINMKQGTVSGTVISNGASFAHKKGLSELFPLVTNLNYDTGMRYNAISSADYIPARPVRDGYTFVGWNTKRDGSGAYVSRAYALKLGIRTLYAIWSPVAKPIPDYSWLIRGTVVGDNDKTFVPSTRMTIAKGEADVFFQYGLGEHLSPIKVEFLDVKKLANMGVDTAKLHLGENLYVEINLDDFAEMGESKDNKKVNTFLLELDDEDILTVCSGETKVFCFNAREMMDSTKNDITVSVENSAVTVFVGKDEICDTKLPDGQFSLVELEMSESKLVVSKA